MLVKEIRELALELRRFKQEKPPEEFEVLLETIDSDLLLNLSNCWQTYARASQLRPENCHPIWMRCCGRGEGKTRSAAELALDVCEDWGEEAEIILCSKTIGDVIKVMIRGKSGLEACARRRGYEVRYIQNHATVYHPSGARMYLTTAEKPDGPRGLQCNFFWLDEISSWQNAIETFENILYAWRLPCPTENSGIITTTPKPNPISQLLIKNLKDLVTVTYGKSRDNEANLDKRAIPMLESIFLGTNKGRQELDGELLEGSGAMVSQDIIHQFRLEDEPELIRRVVSLDPTITANEDSDDAGIIVLGCDNQPIPHAYVLADKTISQATFSDWARATVRAFIDYECDCVIAEINQGGGGIAEVIQIEAEKLSQELGFPIVVPVRTVWAKESKKARAEPVGALYERGRIHHIGYYSKLEKELTEWLPGLESPNRMDALVHGVTHLLLGDKAKTGPLAAYLFE